MNQETRPRASARGFETLDLDPELIAVLQSLGYTEPTPIQRDAIPHVLEARDVLACAQTGTGKTAAFALPILDELLRIESDGRRRPIRALVLAPTRELAAQIAESFRSYTPRGRIRCEVVFGGVGKRPQVTALRRGVDVLVATPGRLLDLMGDGEVDLSQVEMFVLDEADRMLDMGFIPDVRRITQGASARAPDAALLGDPAARDPRARDPAPVRAGGGRRRSDLLDRGAALPVGLLRGWAAQARPAPHAPRERRDRPGARLHPDQAPGGPARAAASAASGVEAAAIHGDKSQNTRIRTLEGFKRGRTRVLVATDVAARGIHVEAIDTVINFDIPTEPETYVHRIGRTGRAGASGSALSLCDSDERPRLASIERLTRRRIETLKTPASIQATRAVQPAPRPANGSNPRRRRNRRRSR